MARYKDIVKFSIIFAKKKSELILRYCCSFILFLKYKLIYTHLCTAILPKHLQKWWFLTLVYPFCYCGSRGLLKRIFIRFKQSLCGYHSSRLEKWNLCLGIPPLVVAHIKKTGLSNCPHMWDRGTPVRPDIRSRKTRVTLLAGQSAILTVLSIRLTTLLYSFIYLSLFLAHQGGFISCLHVTVITFIIVW